MTDRELGRREIRHAILLPYAKIAPSISLKSGAFIYHPPCPLCQRQHEEGDKQAPREPAASCQHTNIKHLNHFEH